MTVEETKLAHATTTECPSHERLNTPGDVYPFHALDDYGIQRAIVTWTLCFNDVLDPGILHDALSRLLEIGDWRKLGGRLRFKENGKLEIHVPRSFTAEQPAVTFTQAAFDIKIQDHPVACRFPKQTDCPSLQNVPRECRPFMVRPDHPPTIDDMVHQNVPQLSLHITSFHDATLVALAWPHPLMDALGHKALLRAWSSMVAGQEEKVPPLLGARKDILLEAESSTGHKDRVHKDQGGYPLERKRLTGMGKIMFIFRSLLAKFWNPPLELRSIFVPRVAFERLQSRVQKEVAEVAETGNQPPFVSEGDILTAWVTRVVASSEPKPRPITIAVVSNVQFRLPLLFTSGGVYVQNMLLLAWAFISPQLASGPAGPIALSHRRHLVEQCTQEQTLSSLRIIRQEIESQGNPTIAYGESDASFICFNNLTKCEIIKSVNFAPAVLCLGEEAGSRSNPPGTMKTFLARNINMSAPAMNFFSVLGKDYGGNYWLSGGLLPRAWAKIEEELKTM